MWVMMSQVFMDGDTEEESTIFWRQITYNETEDWDNPDEILMFDSFQDALDFDDDAFSEHTAPVHEALHVQHEKDKKRKKAKKR